MHHSNFVDGFFETDVLVIGSGGAGCEAAIAADELGARVLIVDRGTFGRSGATVTGGHTCCAAIGCDDSAELHFEDTIRAGHFLSNQRLVEVYTKEAPKRLREVDKYGANFMRDEKGKFSLIEPPGGHTRKRSVHYGWLTGTAIMRGLKREVSRRRIKRQENTVITSLLTDEGCVIGATGLDISNGNFIVFKAKSTVLATGGCGHLYQITTTPLEADGSGYSLAYRAGAELVDMEFVQFIPKQVDPRLAHLNVTLTMFPRWRESIRKEGARLLNAKGEEFIARYDPIRNLYTTRDIISIAIASEVQEGRGTKRGAVYLDLGRVSEATIAKEFDEKLPGSYLPKLRKEKYDLRKMPFEVAPGAHYTMGGIRINENAETGVPGLYAAGEVTGGIDGANRLGCNALTEILVFGKRAGESAATYAYCAKSVEVKDEQVAAQRECVFKYLKSGSGISSVEIRSKLQKIMQTNVGVIRSQERLEEALDIIQSIRRNDLTRISLASDTKIYNWEWCEAILLDLMLECAEIVARAALTRTESRGAHYRSDYPKTDSQNWIKNVVIKQHEGRMFLTTAPVVMTKVKP